MLFSLVAMFTKPLSQKCRSHFYLLFLQVFANLESMCDDDSEYICRYALAFEPDSLLEQRSAFYFRWPFPANTTGAFMEFRTLRLLF